MASTSIRSYRDGIRLFLLFLARENRTPISKLRLRTSAPTMCGHFSPILNPSAATASEHGTTG
ncbi:hypothetical protein [Rhizobium jaguaris]|uniref:hypothetical protein n=1 Tax=Rhizobium jaguaris TaxID=1312183 RepID=UPI0039BEFDE9